MPMKKKILITGSTTGLGLIAGELILKQAHEVVFHARSKSSKMNPDYKYVFGDLSKLEEVKSVAEQANAMGTFDAVIHNAGVYTSAPEELFNVNVVAPFVITSLMNPVERTIILSSGLQSGGSMNLNPKKCNYSDTKMFVVMMAKWFAKKRPDAYFNTVNPGWVPTRMGGSGAPDDLVQGAETQVWLATSNDPAALVSGKYFFHKEQQKPNPLVDSEENQKKLIEFLSPYLS